MNLETVQIGAWQIYRHIINPHSKDATGYTKRSLWFHSQFKINARMSLQLVRSRSEEREREEEQELQLTVESQASRLANANCILA